MVFVNSLPVLSEEHDPQSEYQSGEEKVTRRKEVLCYDNGENCDRLVTLLEQSDWCVAKYMYQYTCIIASQFYQ